MLHPAFATHQRARWMRPDAARFVRPDAAKFLKPGTEPALAYPALARQRDRAQQADDRAIDAALVQERAVLDGLRRDLGQMKSELAWRRLIRALEEKYSPNQPRVPAGSGRESGRWTSGGEGSGRPRVHIYRTNPDDEAAGDGGELDEIVVDGSDGNPGFDNDGDWSELSTDQGSGRPDKTTRDSSPADDRPTKISDSRVVSDADPEPIRPGQRYAQGGNRRGGGGTIRINGQTVELLPGEAARLDIVRSRAQDAIARIRDIDPNWKPAPSAYQTVEGMIRAYEADAIQAQVRASELASQRLLPGPFAGESIPARGPGRANAAEQREINRIGSETGCNSCGTTNPGTKTGNFVADHHIPSMLNPLGRAQRLYPQCLSCSNQQGPSVYHFGQRR